MGHPPTDPVISLAGHAISFKTSSLYCLAMPYASIFMQSYALLQPEILVSQAQEKFDAEGRLTDETTRKFVGKILAALRDWTRRLAR
jgi:hypothetical protein